jgi:DNA-binding NtrC family response regulator
MKVLVVDDQRSARRLISSILQKLPDLEICEADSLDEARRLLAAETIDLALVDIRLAPDTRNRDGLRLLDEMRSSSTIPIVITVSNEMQEIRAAMRAGAYDYILKDELCDEMVLPIVKQLQSRRTLEREVLDLRSRYAVEQLPSGFVGTSAAIVRLRNSIKKVALSDRPVLVVGPTGSGKELVVRALHALGPYPAEPLLDLNCGAIPEALIEAQLFGHERGAFTGAERQQKGYLAAVQRGTLFLDEIAELPLLLQPKLLRVLETGSYRAVGSTTERTFVGRVVAATHADLSERVVEGLFRKDLFYRLNVLVLRVPALEERREDIPALTSHFARRQTRPLRFSPDAMELLCQMSWPGNVRQLRNLVDRLAVFCDDELVTAASLERLGEEVQGVGDELSPSLRSIAQTILRLPVANKMSAVQLALLREAMALTEGNKSAAARMLGVGRRVVERRLDRPAEDAPADGFELDED